MTLPTSPISIQDLIDETNSDVDDTVNVLFTSTTTWTVPAGVTAVQMVAIGGGGGGGGSLHSGNSRAGGAGGPGGVDIGGTIAVTPGEILQIQVGVGGTAASWPGLVVCPGNGTANGGNGGTTRVYRAASPSTNLVLATGGYGGNGGNGDTAPAIDANHSSGGSGNAGTPSLTGNPARPWPIRNSFYYAEGHGNTTRFGAGGDGNGINGAGATCPTPGGVGAVMISYINPPNAIGNIGSLGSYYAGDGIVESPPPVSVFQTSPIPTSGDIELGSFRGVTLIAVNDFVDQNIADSVKTTGYNVATRATALGWDGVSPLNMRITITTGTVLYRTTNGYTFTLPAMPAGSVIELVNNGAIVGRGGAGGDGGGVSGPGPSPSFTNGTNGTAGQPAMLVSWPLTITNNGLIGGGGGGGGGGAPSIVYFDDAGSGGTGGV